MRNFIWGWGFVVLLDNCFIKILGVKANAEGALWCLGICKGLYPFSWSDYWGNDSEVDHLLQGFLNLVVMLNGYLNWVYWMWGTFGLVHIVYIVGIDMMVSKDHGKAFFRDTMLWASTVVGGAISTWLGMVSVLLGVGVLRVGLGFCML